MKGDCHQNLPSSFTLHDQSDKKTTVYELCLFSDDMFTSFANNNLSKNNVSNVKQIVQQKQNQNQNQYNARAYFLKTN